MFAPCMLCILPLPRKKSKINSLLYITLLIGRDRRKDKRSLTLDFEHQHSFFNIYTVFFFRNNPWSFKKELWESKYDIVGHACTPVLLILPWVSYFSTEEINGRIPGFSWPWSRRTNFQLNCAKLLWLHQSNLESTWFIYKPWSLSHPSNWKTIKHTSVGKIERKKKSINPYFTPYIRTLNKVSKTTETHTHIQVSKYRYV